MLGFQASKRINDSILEKRWQRNDTNVEDDPYQTHALAYNMEMGQLVRANIVSNEVDEEDILGLDDKEESEVLKDITKDLEEEKEATNSTTPRSKMGSNDMNNTPKENGYAQYVQHKNKWYNWYSKEVEPRHLNQLWKTPIAQII